MPTWVVTKQESGSRLGAFLKEKLGDVSARLVKSCIERNLCTVNGRTERFSSTVLGFGDKVSFKGDLPNEPKKSDCTLDPSRVLFEDEALLVYNKPMGMTSDGFKTAHRLVHRLDRDTTGALVFAKSEKVFDLMVALFKNQTITKEYLAIVDGIPKASSGIIDNYLGKKHVYQGQTIYGAVLQNGQKAITEWQLISKGLNASLFRCFPKTGRTHQIRAHLSEIGHPILGDYQYGRSFSCSYQPGRYLLHALRISFAHPTKQTSISVEAPIPADMSAAIKELRL